jgi:hypothetical protein
MRRTLARLGSEEADAEHNQNSLHLDPIRINTLMFDLIRNIFPPGTPLPADFPEGLSNQIDSLREFIVAHPGDIVELEDYASDVVNELLYIPEDLFNGYNSYGGRRRARSARRTRRTRRTRRRRSTRRRH